MNDLISAALPVIRWTGLVSVMLLTLAICLPFERWFPRISRHDLTWLRTRVIAEIAVLSFLVSQAFVWWGQLPLINLLLPFKLFSLAKADIPDWVLVVVSILTLDFVYYLTHVMSHLVPPLWRLHRVHHADEHVTALTGFLHHPLESIVASVITMLFVVLLGMPVLVMIVYAGLLSAHSIFSHADVALPGWIDRVLRTVFVTPDLHRTHHSQDMKEGNSNFGGIFSVWDRIFRTLAATPKEPLDALSMGLPAGGRLRAFALWELVLSPFRR